MENEEREKGTDLVNNLADLGTQHAKRFAKVADDITEELQSSIEEAEKNGVSAIFIAASRAAYKGAFKLSMDQNSKNVTLMSVELEKNN